MCINKYYSDEQTNCGMGNKKHEYKSKPRRWQTHYTIFMIVLNYIICAHENGYKNMKILFIDD